MGRRPNATICYGITVPRETLEEFFLDYEETVGFDSYSEALQQRFKNENLAMAFENNDGWKEQDDVLIYIKFFEAYGYCEVTEIDLEDLSGNTTFGGNTTFDRLNEMVFQRIRREMKLPPQEPKWRIFADFY
jgi:hypothetical protein